MRERRHFLRILAGCLAGAGLVTTPVFSFLRLVFAEAKKIILPRATARETLIDKNPALLDTRNLEPTPLKGFGTMGLTDHKVKLEEWRLEVEGEVKKPLHLKYDELRSIAAVEREVLLICPGFFANHGAWKGISIGTLLRMAEANAGVTHVTLRGPAGTYEKVERFPIGEVLSDKVFLAYEVNGERLPERHGYPLRVVAEDHYGYDWVKYVYKVTAEKIQG